MVKRLGEPLEDTKRNNNDENQSSCNELVEKMRDWWVEKTTSRYKCLVIFGEKIRKHEWCKQTTSARIM